MGGLLLLFAIDFPQGNWSLNPAWIILFARVQGFAFNTVHFTSVYAIAFMAAYLAVRDRKTIAPYKWILIIFGSAGLHEWALYLSDYLLTGTLVTAYADAIWFAAFIVLAAIVANPKQRQFLILLGSALFFIMFAYVAFFNNSDLQQGSYTVSAISDNLIEVLSWVAIPMAWSFYDSKS